MLSNRRLRSSKSCSTLAYWGRMKGEEEGEEREEEEENEGEEERGGE